MKTKKIEIKLKTILNFGKYEGKKVMILCQEDPVYLQRLNRDHYEVHTTVDELCDFYNKKNQLITT